MENKQVKTPQLLHWMPRLLLAWLATALLALGQPAAAQNPNAANTITVTDVLGRRVSIRQPVERIILEESRQLYTVAMLEPGDPTQRIVGWGKDMQEADPATYQAYRQRFPHIDRIAVLGRFSKASFDLERALALKPDVLFLNMETERMAQDSAYLKTLDKMGIPVVYVDFRHQPDRNTEASVALFGQILQREARAQAFIDMRRQALARVARVLDEHKPQRPGVFIERIAGLGEDCCFSFGRENFGRYVELAGGRNLAAGLIPGTFGQISPEQVLAFNPDVVLLTSADWSAYNPVGGWIPVGPGADAQRVQTALRAYPGKLAYAGTRAAHTGRFHAVWHQFYNSPYDFIVVQQLAEWLHPKLFAQGGAQASFRQLHEKLLPIDYQPGHFASLPGQ